MPLPRTVRIPALGAAFAAIAALTACGTDASTSSPLSPATSAFLNADVAAVSVETLGQDVELMRGPGGAFGFGLAADRGRFECSSEGRDGLTVTRTCTYKDAA
ncbi:MAG TPA: hypothetical protein VFV33_05370, partial [Gemmatimonadaceae bacterium]|nr:hypothetical protein [Gemmatimonadaceae bacterium]